MEGLSRTETERKSRKGEDGVKSGNVRLLTSPEGLTRVSLLG